jgi:ribosomal-protein-alanine N-acetyltransferase
MDESHVKQIAELEKLCFNDPWSENSIASELNNRLSLWLVAVEDDLVVGYVGSQTVLGETDMMNIATHPDYRKQGIGTALINELITELKNRRRFCLICRFRCRKA